LEDDGLSKKEKHQGTLEETSSSEHFPFYQERSEDKEEMGQKIGKVWERAIIRKGQLRCERRRGDSPF